MQLAKHLITVSAAKLHQAWLIIWWFVTVSFRFLRFPM